MSLLWSEGDALRAFVTAGVAEGAHVPPPEVQSAAQAALSDPECTGAARARARQLAAGRPLPEASVRQMLAYFAVRGADPAWGGEPAMLWVSSLAGDTVPFRFNPSQPRDWRGRWINVGDTVDMPGGGKGKVVGIKPGGKVDIEVKAARGGGKSILRDVDGKHVGKAEKGSSQPTDVGRGSSSPPGSKPGTVNPGGRDRKEGPRRGTGGQPGKVGPVGGKGELERGHKGGSQPGESAGEQQLKRDAAKWASRLEDLDTDAERRRMLANLDDDEVEAVRKELLNRGGSRSRAALDVARAVAKERRAGDGPEAPGGDAPGTPTPGAGVPQPAPGEKVVGTLGDAMAMAEAAGEKRYLVKNHSKKQTEITSTPPEGNHWAVTPSGELMRSDASGGHKPATDKQKASAASVLGGLERTSASEPKAGATPPATPPGPPAAPPAPEGPKPVPPKAVGAGEAGAKLMTTAPRENHQAIVRQLDDAMLQDMVGHMADWKKAGQLDANGEAALKMVRSEIARRKKGGKQNDPIRGAKPAAPAPPAAPPASPGGYNPADRKGLGESVVKELAPHGAGSRREIIASLPDADVQAAHDVLEADPLARIPRSQEKSMLGELKAELKVRREKASGGSGYRTPEEKRRDAIKKETGREPVVLTGVEQLGPARQRKFEAAQRAIARVHSTEGMRSVRVTNDDPVPKNALATFQGSYSRGRVQPEIRVKNPKSGHASGSIVHEIGHAIDWDSGVRGETGFASRDKAASGPVQKAFDDFLTATQESQALAKIRGMRKSTSRKEMRDYLDYLATPHEMWARAYHQYIVQKGGDSEMKDEMRSMQQAGMFGPPAQWETGDFQRNVAPAVEAVLKAKGWL